MCAYNKVTYSCSSAGKCWVPSWCRRCRPDGWAAARCRTASRQAHLLSGGSWGWTRCCWRPSATRSCTQLRETELPKCVWLRPCKFCVSLLKYWRNCFQVKNVPRFVFNLVTLLVGLNGCLDEFHVAEASCDKQAQFLPMLTYAWLLPTSKT